MISYKDLIKCQNNPSVEFPKFIKNKLGTDAKFRILEVADLDGFKQYIIATDESEYEIESNGRVVFKESGITGIHFMRTTIVGASKLLCYFLADKRVKYVDKTQKFIDGYISQGKCFYSEGSHNLVDGSTNTKICSYCNCRFKKKIKYLKKVQWVKA